MKCPVCKTPDLLMAERQWIEIDYCPTCRGVWLDRGELDKLIARETGEVRPDVRNDVRNDARANAPADGRPDRHAPRGRDGGWPRDARADDDRHRHGGQRRKRSVFDLFDFD
ncbi:zf-TFIIB domain-containing protein [Burkholderia vietnamiensis]|uniref:TFIIB-type zinc ribbon-containing protein n=1 Tax=Burkholderia vietnamiensis TaxID=60552 RepID=UPI00075394CB|nr:zf-TFIIB domain-containing protein [Burkholderia vietnamiensis]KVF35696.1 hypothetical protein WJ09_09365 [Burkholderia vietnamiensis]KVS22861.1 hypothetical protein WK34_03280 [Burkholderia vietnamiensis]MBR8014382.1 zf-TFIIB domain-containing protein [Burkholderia vietnamiensis]MDN7412223.1 zf-TFIIB domain-containing protein [Burkholderia vietnamiensis]MDN8115586.1 zf-TFIIB domain-containing protein [Burkholderia vietnamiensis]